jgi:hypothetical protein
MSGDTSAVTFGTWGSVTFAGKDAVALYRAIALKAGLNLAAKGMAVNRHMTRAKLLAAAGQLTGKRYKRGAYLTAAEDVQTWIDAMRSAIPVVVEPAP